MLSPKQQGIYRPLVQDAWMKCCARDSGLDPLNKSARNKWYRAELMKALGIYSTTEAKAAREFARLCAHFEQLIGRSAYWTLRAEQSEEVRRVRWWIEQALLRIGGNWRYAQGLIDQANFTGPDLDDLDLGQLHKVFQMLDTHLRRTQKKRAEEMDVEILDWKDAVRAAHNDAPAHPHRRAA